MCHKYLVDNNKYCTSGTKYSMEIFSIVISDINAYTIKKKFIIMCISLQFSVKKVYSITNLQCKLTYFMYSDVFQGMQIREPRFLY